MSEPRSVDDGDKVADFFREVMDQDSQRAHRCHELLRELGGHLHHLTRS